MTRLLHAWSAMSRERRLAAAAALALLVTMFLPWYGLQSLNRKTGVIYSHDISAFGDVSFVEAAVFLVAAAVMALLLARAEGREFHMPGGDGTIVTIAGAWAGLLIFYRVFSRPSGDGYPVGIEWGFFLAFVAAGSLAFAGWRMRPAERPEPPVSRGGSRRPRRAADEEPQRPPADFDPAGGSQPGERGSHATLPVRTEQPPAATEETVLAPGSRPASRPARPRPAKDRPPFPPAPPEQLSFEDTPHSGE